MRIGYLASRSNVRRRGDKANEIISATDAAIKHIIMKSRHDDIIECMWLVGLQNILRSPIDVWPSKMIDINRLAGALNRRRAARLYKSRARVLLAILAARASSSAVSHRSDSVNLHRHERGTCRQILMRVVADGRAANRTINEIDVAVNKPCYSSTWAACCALFH